MNKEVTYLQLKHGGLVFNIAEIDADPVLDLEQVFENYDAVIFNCAVENIKISLENNTDSVPVFVIKENDSLIEIENQDYEEWLENAICYYQQHQDYEKCLEIKKLLKK